MRLEYNLEFLHSYVPIYTFNSNFLSFDYYMLTLYVFSSYILMWISTFFCVLSIFDKKGESYILRLWSFKVVYMLGEWHWFHNSLVLYVYTCVYVLVIFYTFWWSWSSFIIFGVHDIKIIYWIESFVMKSLCWRLLEFFIIHMWQIVTKLIQILSKYIRVIKLRIDKDRYNYTTYMLIWESYNKNLKKMLLDNYRV